ncbi:hypothetical protein SSX86_012169 [Deinandra increscens subsp. villosa]|uniref:F-box domain-containing protein n=1 Tax=Deinandra increscens subsp. villosa TaxID=3103831 RepID=A0AAP0D7U5_9ASTR
MLDQIPFEIKLEIMKTLPVKSLLQFRSVSKTWKSLIDSPDFVARYTALQPQPQHLLVAELALDKYVFAIFPDDDTFPQQKLTFTTQKDDSTFPRLLNCLNLTVRHYRLVGSSHGLVCLYDGDHPQGRRGGHGSVTGMAILWNLSIRKAVGVIVPNLGEGMFWTVLGFGICGETMDPKIVKITYIIDKEEIDVESVSCIPWQVEVFTLSTGEWRIPYRNLPRKSIRFGYQPQVVVDGFLYWLATDKFNENGAYKSYSLIVSFDMTTEEFGEVNLPDNLALVLHTTNHVLQINKLRKTLVVIDQNQDVNESVMGLWMRVDGVFTKLFNLKVNTQHGLVWGFRKNGAPIVDTEDGFSRDLVVYEPSSKNMDGFWIHDIPSWAFVYPYVETLLLLDQPDLMVYNDV